MNLHPIQFIYDDFNAFLFSLVANQNDTIDPESIVKEPANGAMCKFGNLTLLQGEQLKSEENDLLCKCSLPPMITCTKPSGRGIER